MKTPLKTGLLQSDIDFAGYKLLNADLSDYVLSVNLVFLSKTVTSDAAGAIGYGSTAPSGTDVTADVQAAIDSVPAGGTLVWDVAVGLSAPILIPSNITIIAPGREFGAIQRAAANCPMFQNVGMTTDATTSKQKTFGKLDPDHIGNASYRVLDPINFINDRNITMRGGTWNGNRNQQTGSPFTVAYGFASQIKFYGVENVLLEDMYFIEPHGCLPVDFCNWHRVQLIRCEIDGSPLDFVNADKAVGGFQFEGPGRYLRAHDNITHVSDDHFGINPDAINAASVNAVYGGGNPVATEGVNWPCCGDITDVRITGHTMSPGIEDGINGGCVRLFSAVHLCDDILIDGMKGRTSVFGCNITSKTLDMQIEGTGNLGNVELRNFTAELENSNSATTGLFNISAGGKSIRITGRKRGVIPSPATPDITIEDTAFGSIHLRELVLEGTYDDDGSGGDLAAAQILCAAQVDNITVRTNANCSTITASPVLLTASGALIDVFDFLGDVNKITNIVKHVAGTLTTVLMRGSHRNAGGGSPLDIANALTVTNGWHPDLAFVSGNGFKSGAGTLTHDNDYTDP